MGNYLLFLVLAPLSDFDTYSLGLAMAREGSYFNVRSGLYCGLDVMQQKERLAKLYCSEGAGNNCSYHSDAKEDIEYSALALLFLRK